MGSIVHRSVPTNLKWFPNCSHAHALFQDRFKDVQVGSRWFSTLYILSPNFHNFVCRLGFEVLYHCYWWQCCDGGVGLRSRSFFGFGAFLFSSFSAWVDRPLLAWGSALVLVL